MATNTPTAAPSMLDALRAAPAPESAEYVNPWIPTEPGEGIEGTVIAIGQYHDDRSDRVLRTYTIQTDDGTPWSIIPFHRVLRSELAKNPAMVNDRLAILFVDDVPSETDPEKVMKDYRVAVKKVRSMKAARTITPSGDPFDTLK